VAYVDQGYTERTQRPQGRTTASDSSRQTPMDSRGFVLPPRCRVVERSFALAARFRRLARDCERLDTTLKDFHYLSFPLPHVLQDVPPTHQMS
jgi:transposase